MVNAADSAATSSTASARTGRAGERPTYGNWSQPSTPGLPGLGLLGTVIALGGGVLAVLAQMVGGWRPAVVVVGLVAVAIVPILYRNRSGRNGWQAGSAQVGWRLGRARRQHLYRSSVLAAPTAAGTATLPGLLARSTLYEAVDSYGQPFALLHVPATRHYSVIVHTTPEGSQLVDEETVDDWVARWGAWLSELAREPYLEAASATVETAPDPGNDLAREVSMLLTPEAPLLARSMLNEVRATYARGGPQVSGRIALTFSATRRLIEDQEMFRSRRSRRGKQAKQVKAGQRGSGRRSAVMSAQEMAEQIGSRLPGLIRELGATGAGGGARAMTVAEVSEVVRVAYDPGVADALDAASAQGRDLGIAWEDAGPVAQEEGWGQLLHDSGVSVTWQMTEAPRSAVASQVLRALLEPIDGLTRKRVTLLFRPHSPAEAARIADADVRTAIGRASARAGENRAGDVLELEAARQTAREEARGAGLTRFALLCTATVSDPEDLPTAVDKIDQAGGASRVRLRRVYGAQSAAFATALGIGLMPSRHTRVPIALREYL